ncbi:murein transglycosylase [Pararoseomonas sp. SCSIO 73927]|uniref:murein transglycosylase n=1 Tax=Pararoseomonas sp. SCSIO 73927 TaxID=3114537 RepID=UPI0030CDC8C0
MSRALRLVALAAFLVAHGPARAQEVDDRAACMAAIARVEPGSGITPGLLAAIARVESGRADPSGPGGPPLWPWPWAYNAAGEGRFAESRAAAIAEVAALRARGVQSVDVGCMQVNLLHHPAAFASLADAFDPLTNVRYAAAFLLRLRAETGGWEAAVARYHSGDPERGAAYGQRVALAQLGRPWDGAAPASAPAPRPRPAACTRRGAAVVVVRAGGDAAGGAVSAGLACTGRASTRRAPGPGPAAPLATPLATPMAAPLATPVAAAYRAPPRLRVAAR